MSLLFSQIMLKLFRKVAPIRLGRWSSEKPMANVDFANSDHCGTCFYQPQNEFDSSIKIPPISQMAREKIFCEACGGTGYCINKKQTLCSSCMGSGVRGYTYF